MRDVLCWYEHIFRLLGDWKFKFALFDEITWEYYPYNHRYHRYRIILVVQKRNRENVCLLYSGMFPLLCPCDVKFISSRNKETIYYLLVIKWQKGLGQVIGNRYKAYGLQLFRSRDQSSSYATLRLSLAFSNDLLLFLRFFDFPLFIVWRYSLYIFLTAIFSCSLHNLSCRNISIFTFWSRM